MNKHISSAELVDYAPRSKVRDWLVAGWRLIPGMEYRPDEYAVVMHKPEVASPVCVQEVTSIFARPMPVPKKYSVDGCENRYHGSGLCKHHHNIEYGRLRRQRERLEAA